MLPVLCDKIVTDGIAFESEDIILSQKLDLSYVKEAVRLLLIALRSRITSSIPLDILLRNA
jgi:hypothetical protein